MADPNDPQAPDSQEQRILKSIQAGGSLSGGTGSETMNSQQQRLQQFIQSQTVQTPKTQDTGTNYGGYIPNTNAGVWGPVNNTLNSVLLGYGIPLVAGAAAAKQGLGEVLSGTPLSQAWHDTTNFYYPQAHDIYQGAQQSYANQHPLEAGLTNVAGGTIGGAAALAAPEALMARAGSAILPYLPEALGGAARTLAGYGGGASTAGQIGSKALLGARQGMELEEAYNSPQKDKNLLLAAGLGAGAGALGRAVEGPLASVVDQGIDPQVQQNALGLRWRGVPVQGADLSGQLAPFRQQPTSAPAEAATRAALSDTGSTGNRITPDTIEAQRQVIGNHLDDIASRIGGVNMFGAPGGPSVANDLSDIRTRMASDPNLVDLNIRAGTPQPLDGKYPHIMSVMSKVENSMDPTTGQIPGDQYVTLTRSGKAKGDVALLADDPNPIIAQYGKAMQKALEDGLDRSAPPGLSDELSQTRAQYKAVKTLEKVAQGTEANSAGILNAGTLGGPLKTQYPGGANNAMGDIYAGNKLIPKVDALGETKPLPAKGFLNRIAHGGPGGILGTLGLGGLGMELAGAPLEDLITHSPVMSALGGIGALTAGAVLPAARRAAIRTIANSPGYTNLLLGGGPGADATRTLLRLGERAPIGVSNALLNPGSKQ